MSQKPAFLPSLSANRPVTATMLLAAIILVGIIAYFRIPLEMFPSGFENPRLWVWVPYPNANPQEVEEQIARPIEEEVSTISGIKSVETHSSSSGCWCGLEFAGGTDMTIAYDQLRDRMERARANLPDDLERYYLRKSGNDNIPVLFLSVNFPEGLEDSYFLADYYLKRPIERIDGVANVEIWGADEKSIQIMVDQDKVRAHNINLFQVINNLRNDNFGISSGWVYEGDKKFVLRSLAKFKDLDQIRNLPINANNLTVGDIASVEYDVPERDWTQRVNGKPGILLGVFQESLANTVNVSRAIQEMLDQEINSRPQLKGAVSTIFFSQGKMIEKAIDNLRDTALWGGVFAVLILLFFLRDLRMTTIMMLSIPLSVLIALCGIYFIGWTLNLFTMMGLMISVGMVVDNGIVVLENIYERRNKGEDRHSASIWGASEVNLAIIMATLTTICVFVPMLLIDDSDGGLKFYLQRIGLPVIFALAGSLFVALVLIPLATTRIRKGGDVNQDSKLIGKGQAFYRRSLGWSLKHRFEVMAIILMFIAITGAAMQNGPQSGDEGGGISDINLIFDLAGNYTQEEIDDYMGAVEDTLFANATRYKLRALDTGYRKTFGRIRVFLEDPEDDQWYEIAGTGLLSLIGLHDDNDMPKDSIIADIKRRMPTKPGIKMRTSWRSGDTDEGGSVSIFLYGDDTGKLTELAAEVERRMELLEGVISVETDQEIGTDEVKISMDREIVTRNGINPTEVASSLMYAVRGFNLPRYQATDRDVQVLVQLQEKDRQNLNQLKNMTFFSSSGQPVPLSALASFTMEKGFGEIHRRDGKTYMRVRAQTTSEDMQNIARQIDAFMEDFPMPVGYDWQKGNSFRDLDDLGAAFKVSILLALVFVYLVMAILFESLVYPLSVIISIPLAFFGAFMALAITQTGLGLMAIIGIIILIGVVVNNGIILVDMINRKRAEGFSRTDAIMEAGRNRFRPILMTTFTTIGGLIPMAIGTAELFTGLPYYPMGRAIIGGMLTSAMLTLVVVPVFYTLLDDLSVWLSRFFGIIAAKTRSKGAAIQ